MPRKSRIDAPDALQHVIGRGISRRKIFSNDGDRDDFLKRLSGSTKRPQHLLARGILCFWATRELGITQSELAGRLKMSQPAISYTVRRGGELVKERQLKLMA